jgi:hypothetical protein
MSIQFDGVVALLAFSPQGTELSHLERCDADPLLVQVRQRHNDAGNLFAFRFISAWDAQPVLTVIASACRQQES